MSAEEIRLTKVNSLKGQQLQEEDKRGRTVEDGGPGEWKRTVEREAREEGKEADELAGCSRSEVEAVQFHGQWPNRGGALRVRVHRHGATKKTQKGTGARRNRGRIKGGRILRFFASAVRIVTCNAFTAEYGSNLRDHWSERCACKCTHVHTHARMLKHVQVLVCHTDLVTHF